ncbi:MAG: helix-turn-helix transcriptional regulator [Planctomycetota bacterium]
MPRTLEKNAAAQARAAATTYCRRGSVEIALTRGRLGTRRASRIGDLWQRGSGAQTNPRVAVFGSEHGSSLVNAGAEHANAFWESQRVPVVSTRGVVVLDDPGSSGCDGWGSPHCEEVPLHCLMPAPSPYEVFAENLRVLMAKRNVNQTDVSKATRIAPATISDYANVKRKGPRLNHVKAIADYFDVSIDFMLGRSACALVPKPGRFLVDLDEEREPTSADADWMFEVPPHFDIQAIDKKDVAERSAAVRDRWRARKGRGDAKLQG